MCEVAAYTAIKADAAVLGLEFKPRSAEVRSIFGRPPALDQPQEDGLSPRARAAIWREKSRPAAGGRALLSCRGVGVKHSPYSVTNRTTGEGAAGAGKGTTKAGAAPARGKGPVYQPTPNTGMKRPDNSPAPDPNDDRRDQSGYGRNMPADQAKHAY